MKFRYGLLACLVLVAASASAQMRIEPLQQATPSPAEPRIEPLEATPSPAEPVVPIQELQADPNRLQVNTPEERLKQRIAELERRTAKLDAENAELRRRVRNFTSLGGSEVRAYCSARTVSANTTGATRNCGAYSCNDVTGQCLESCREASDCGGEGANCDRGQCIFGAPPCEGENCS